MFSRENAAFVSKSIAICHINPVEVIASSEVKKVEKGEVHIIVPLNVNIVLSYEVWKQNSYRWIVVTVWCNLQLQLHAKVNVLCCKCINVLLIALNVM